MRKIVSGCLISVITLGNSFYQVINNHKINEIYSHNYFEILQREKVSFDRNIDFINLIMQPNDDISGWFTDILKENHKTKLDSNDKIFLSKWDNILTRKASNKATKIKDGLETIGSYFEFNTLEAINNIWNDNDEVNWMPFFKINTVGEMKQAFISFFGQLNFLYGKKFLKNSLTKLQWTYIQELNGLNGIVNKDDDNQMINLLLFGAGINKEDAWKWYQGDWNIITYNGQEFKDYIVNPTSAAHNVFAHEYGHLVSYYTYFKNNNQSGAFHLWEWLNKKINFNNYLSQMLFSWILVPSNYHIFHPLESTWIEEWFGEAFAYWMLTPKHLRTYGWEILNQYFMLELPKIIKS